MRRVAQRARVVFPDVECGRPGQITAGTAQSALGVECNLRPTARRALDLVELGAGS